MARYREPDPDDFEVTDEERRAARTSAGAQAEKGAYGSGIGGVLGALAGGVLGTAVVPGLGTAAGAGLGASAGSAIGGAIGGQMGSDEASRADEVLSEAEEKRRRKLAEMEQRERALDDFLAQG